MFHYKVTKSITTTLEERDISYKIGNNMKIKFLKGNRQRQDIPDKYTHVPNAIDILVP